MQRPRLIYIAPSQSTFVKRDIRLLSTVYKVSLPVFDWHDRKRLLVALIRQFFYLLFNMRRVSAIVVMFGGYWAVFPVVFGKVFRTPVYIILGGADCVSFPSLSYGSLRKTWMRKLLGFVYRNATALIPVDESLIRSRNTYHQSPDPVEQGVMSYYPNLTTPFHVVYNGFDSKYYFSQLKKIPGSFVTVAYVPDNARFVLKGINIVVKLAQSFPQYQFTVIGVTDEMKERVLGPDNLTVLPPLDREGVRDHLAGYEFYLQLSVSEGFPNAICEAMLMKCIPIGSAVGGIPKIVNNTGAIVRTSDFESIRSVVGQCLDWSVEKKEEQGARARLHIEREFPIEKRAHGLLRILSGQV